MKTYEMKMDEMEETDGVFALSTVADPANERMFIALSAADVEVKLSAEDEEKRVLTGVVLIPEQKILRKNPKTGESYNIFFSAETIEATAQKFFRKGLQGETTLQHQKAVEGNYLYESWIVEDPKKDKSVALGMSPQPAGTWIVSMKTTEDFWDKEVKTGNVKGFSIEGLFSDAQLAMMQEESDEVRLAKECLDMIEKLTKNS